MDIETADMKALTEALAPYNHRKHLLDTLRKTKDSQDPSDLVLRGFTKAELAAMGQRKEPVISALDALRAEHRMVEIARGMRWAKVMDAREDGASWAEIATVLDIDANYPAQSARAWYADRIAALADVLDEDDLTRAKAMIDDPAVVDGQPVAAAES